MVEERDKFTTKRSKVEECKRKITERRAL